MNFLIAILVLVGLLVSIALDPTGALNHWLNKLINMIGESWPETPDRFTLPGLFDMLFASDAVPSFACTIASEVLTMIRVLILVMVFIKVYKLVPFKMT